MVQREFVQVTSALLLEPPPEEPMLPVKLHTVPPLEIVRLLPAPLRPTTRVPLLVSSVPGFRTFSVLELAPES